MAAGPDCGSLNAIRLDSVRDTAITVRKNMDALRMSMRRHVNTTACLSDDEMLRSVVESVKNDGVNSARFLDRTPDKFQKLVNFLNYEELNGAEFFFRQASWSKEMTENERDPVMMKATWHMLFKVCT